MPNTESENAISLVSLSSQHPDELVALREESVRGAFPRFSSLLLLVPGLLALRASLALRARYVSRASPEGLRPSDASIWSGSRARRRRPDVADGRHGGHEDAGEHADGVQRGQVDGDNAPPARRYELLAARQAIRAVPARTPARPHARTPAQAR